MNTNARAGAAPTFIGTEGHGTRPDYVLLSRDVMPRVVRTKVRDTVGLKLQKSVRATRLDHAPVRAEVMCNFTCAIWCRVSAGGGSIYSASN